MIREITVIDPQHPLRGERLALLSLSCGRGPNFIAVGLPDGRRCLIRRAATDLDQPAMIEPVVQRVSVRTLLPLARHLRRILATSQEEAPQNRDAGIGGKRPGNGEALALAPDRLARRFSISGSGAGEWN